MNTKEIQILQTILKQRDDLKSKLGGKHDKLVQARIYENEKLGKQIAEVMIQKENLPQ